MSFDRRWFLSAAGSAFIASISGVLEAAGKAPKPQSSGDSGEDAKRTFTHIKTGYQKAFKDDEETRCQTHLERIYKERYFRLYDKLSEAQRTHLMGFAFALGTLTQRALENERDGTCGWKQDANAKLREEHIDRAREQLGYYLSSCLDKANACKTGPPLKLLEVDQPCPLCPP